MRKIYSGKERVEIHVTPLIDTLLSKVAPLETPTSHLATKTLDFDQIKSLIDRCSLIARLETADNSLRTGK